MIKNLVIVESPAKAKTIEKYLGAGFTVTSSMGHIRDLGKGENAIDIESGFKPKYEVSVDKRDLVKNLKKLVSTAEIVWLATDEDREGEAISWHLFDELGLKEENTRRIVFNEITKPAILRAIENPRTIDKFLVDAQQARRVLDRLVGYELSPVLWKKVKPQLSAGRVQSVAVRLVVEREREINDFTAKYEFRITGIFTTADKKDLKADYPIKFKTEAEAREFLNSLINSDYQVSDIEIKPAFRNPSPPFTTSTLQQEASRKLGFDVTRTMQIAQRLYENGHITYMRTDSVNLSQMAIGTAKEEIIRVFGEKYSSPRNFQTKNDSAQEAHEAIRPTYFSNQMAGDDAAQKKLYDLIWKRTMASQMAKAELERTIVKIKSNSCPENFVSEGEVIRFDGFLKLYIEGNDDENDEETTGLLPPVKSGDILNAQKIEAAQKYSRPAPRFTEASLVKKLEELGIGRPSTYAPTISTVQKRGYAVNESRDGNTRDIKQLLLQDGAITEKVEKEKFGYEKNKLFPTDIGMLVTDFLLQNFDEIMDYGFTASVEKEFDEIARGMKSWQKMLEGFYGPFHKSVENTTETAARVTGERILGVDPKTGKQVSVRIGRFGPLVQIGVKDDTESPVFASLQKSQSIETITLDAALKLFALPKEVCNWEGKPVIAGIGRYGPYLKMEDKFYSVPKGIDMATIGEAEALELLKAALSAPQFPIEIGEYEGAVLTVNKGRFGPFIKFNSAFISIPRGVDPTSVSLEYAIELIKAKEQVEKDNTLREFPENKEIKILKGRYGPYISFGKANIAFPKNAEIDSLSYDEILKIVESAPVSKSASKTSAKPATKKNPAAKTAVKKKTTAKKKK